MPSLVFFSPGWYNLLIKTKGVRSMKRCLVLSDSFKGTLSSPDICRIARSLHIPGWHIDALPVADGGEGTTDCFLDACGGQRIALPVSGPFGGTIDGFYGLLPDGTVVVECAAAAGLHQTEGRPDPEAATTYGVGQLLAHALDHGAARSWWAWAAAAPTTAAAVRLQRLAFGFTTGRAAASCPPAARWRTSRLSTCPGGTPACGPVC